VQFAEQYLEPYFNLIAAQAPVWLKSYLNARDLAFDRLAVRVVLTDDEKKAALAFMRALGFDYVWPERRALASGSKPASTLRTFKESGEPTIHFFAEGRALEDLPKPLIISEMANTVLQYLHRFVYPNTYVFPVERTMYMTVIPPTIYEGDSLEQRPRSPKFASESAPRTIEPVREFMRLVSSAVQTDLQDRHDPEDIPELKGFVTKYLDLATILERDILGGRVSATRVADDLPREILFHPLGGVALSLPLVSSMVKELSPLLLYVVSVGW